MFSLDCIAGVTGSAIASMDAGAEEGAGGGITNAAASLSPRRVAAISIADSLDAVVGSTYRRRCDKDEVRTAFKRSCRRTCFVIAFLSFMVCCKGPS